MAEDNAKEELNPEVIDQIESFQGPIQPQTMADGVIASGGTMLQTKTGYTTAVRVQQPRSITKIAKNVMTEAELAGSDFYYRWDVKTKSGKRKPVQGGSIDLATCLFRNYGNAAMDITVQETATHYIFTANFIDLETGMTWPRMFRQRKTVDMGKFDKDRAEDIVFQIGQSKCERNAILSIMPNWLIEKAIERAKQAELNKLSDKKELVAARIAVVEYFEGWGISQDRLEAKIGRPADQFTAEDVESLRASASAIKEKRAYPEEIFPPVDSEPEKKPAPEKQASTTQAEKKPEKEQTSSPDDQNQATHELDQMFGIPDDKEPDYVKDGPPAQEPPQEEMADAAAHIWEKENWFRMQAGKSPDTGFKAFVMKNIASFPLLPAKLQGEIIQKWSNLYDIPFPVPPNKQQQAPETATSQPDSSQAGLSEDPGADDAEKTQKQINAELKKEFPDEWERARHELGFAQTPATDQAAKFWNDLISKYVDEGSV